MKSYISSRCLWANIFAMSALIAQTSLAVGNMEEVKNSAECGMLTVRQLPGTTPPDQFSLNMEAKTWRMLIRQEGPGPLPEARENTALLKQDSAITRKGIQEETFYLIVFPFFLILFVGAIVCLCLGVVAWSQESWNKDTRSLGAQGV